MRRAKPAGSRFPLSFLLLALAWSAGACGGEPEQVSPALLELERLAFLPRGEVVPSIEAGAFGSDAPLLVDMYEVTRGDWKRYQTETNVEPDPLLGSFVAGWTPDTDDWPAAYMTWSEAAAFAEWRGMRLLDLGEWLFCAMGASARAYPWGTTPQQSISNTLELRLERPAPVGTFESGRTPQWCYDLLGNVSEWISEPAPSNDLIAGDARVSAMGGSYLAHLRPLYRRPLNSLDRAFFAELLHPGTRSVDVGLRCAAPAAEYLWRRAPDWGTGEATLARLTAVGERWGRQASPLLDGLAAREGAPPGLRALAEGARR
jgi:hypothetical protein